MKWLERTIWVALVVALAMGTLVMWALWRSTEEITGREQYMNYWSRLNLQQELERGNFDRAVTSNREWLSTWWSIYLTQEQHDQLLISEKDFEMLRGKLEASQLGIASQEQN